MYARAERAQICWTLGITEHHNAVDNVLALINLALLTGHVGRYGSGLNPLRGQNNVQGGGDMGAIPNRLPGFQDLETDPEAVAKFERAWDTKLKPHYGWHMTEMFEAMERGELTTLFVLGENPVQSDADAHHVKKLLGGLEHFVVQDIFLTATAQMADVVLPASASWAESEGTVTNSERRVQRCRKALDPPGQARDDTRILVDLAARLGHEWHYESSEEIWNELRSLAPNHAGMSYRRLEELGGIQWPCYSEDKLEPTFLHGRLWEEPRTGRPRCSTSSRTIRRSTSSRTSSRSASRPAAGWTRSTPACRPAATARRCAAPRSSSCPRADAAELGVTDGDRVRITSRNGEVEAPVRVDRALRPGLAFMTLHFPDEVRDEPPDHQQHRPEVRDGRVQGDGHPRRAARPRRARGHVRRRRSGVARRTAPLMDIVLHKDEPSAAERDAVDAVLGPPDSRWVGALTTSDRDRRVARGGHAARAQRHLLLPTLHAVQSRAGWISPGALNYICQRLTIPPAEAYGVATFYALFSLEPQPPAVAHVCTDIACMAGGAKKLCADLETRIGPKGGQHGSNGAGPGEDPIWLESPCLGMCEMAPVAMVSIAGEEPREVSVGHAEADDIAAMLAGGDAPPPVAPKVPQAGDPGLRLLRRIGQVDPTSVDSYRAHGGYEALRAALEMGEQGVLREVADAKLLGRGGAAFPTGRKWAAVAAHPTRPHYLICNADESEPGTFKDRVLLEHDPFVVIESMTIAGFATGCEHGYLYLRGEYPLAWERLVGAVTEARARGFLGQDIFGQGINFDIELRKGAGAYICGEETALFNSIEGYRGEPRNKPPFPVEHGLFDKPTVINNVETLVNVPGIVLDGGQAYARIGTEDSTGTRLFCVSGRVEQPGLYEAPFGVTLREVLDMAGGVIDGRPLRTILLGGAAGRFVTPDELDVEMSFEATREAGVSMGSGVVMVVDDTVDMPAILMRIAAFFRDESCGQCVPCRVGTVRQEEALARLTNGHPRGTPEQEYALLDEITASMRDSSICGLGQTAADAIESALRKLDVFETGGQR